MASKLNLLILMSVSVVHIAKAQCPHVEIVTRAEWNARPPRHVTPLKVPVNMTFLHHTAEEPCTDKDTCIKIVQNIQKVHMDERGWDDIGYNFLVGEDGRVYEGRGWQTMGAHCPVYNKASHGICIIGNFMKRAPDLIARDAAQVLIQCGVEKGYIQHGYELFGHRDGRCTECPGDVLYKIIQTWPHYSFRKIPVIC